MGNAPIPPMSLAVVGVAYLNADGSNRRFEIELLAPGEPIDLVPEPKNKKDPRAVAVFAHGGGQLGYLTAERCGRIGALIREGVAIRAVFQQQTPWGCWIRATFDGSAPVVDLDAKPLRAPPQYAEGVDPVYEFDADPDYGDV